MKVFIIVLILLFISPAYASDEDYPEITQPRPDELLGVGKFSRLCDSLKLNESGYCETKDIIENYKEEDYINILKEKDCIKVESRPSILGFFEFFFSSCE